MPGTASSDRERAFTAVAHLCGELREPVQDELFAQVVTAGGRSEQAESQREELAHYLRKRHPCTAPTGKQ